MPYREPRRCMSSEGRAASGTRERLGGGLPQLDAIALRIDRPVEPPDAGELLGLADHRDAVRPELLEHRVEVPDAEVQHPPLLRTAEVVGVGRKRREHGRSLLGPPHAVVGTFDINVHAEDVAIPARQGGGVRRPKEDAADPGDSLHRPLLRSRRCSLEPRSPPRARRSRRTRIQSATRSRSIRLSRSGSARMSIETIRPRATVSEMMANGRPSGVHATPPGTPLTRARVAVAAN